MVNNVSAKNLSGFTLIETLLYSLFFAFIIGSALGATFQIVQGSQSLTNKTIVEDEANFVLKKIEWTLTGVKTINQPVSGSSGPILSVDKDDYGSNPVIIDLFNGDLRIKKGSANPVILNSQNITASSLSFEHIKASATSPAAVRANFKISDQPFEIIKYLRK